MVVPTRCHKKCTGPKLCTERDPLYLRLFIASIAVIDLTLELYKNPWVWCREGAATLGLTTLDLPAQTVWQCGLYFLPMSLKWCLHRRENIKRCRYRQRWRFEKMVKFLLKLHRSAKSLDPHRVCEQTLNVSKSYIVDSPIKRYVCENIKISKLGAMLRLLFQPALLARGSK
jgi:hypothetical protein